MKPFVELPQNALPIYRLIATIFKLIVLILIFRVGTAIAAPATGHVVDSSGNPVSGATVYVLDWQHQDNPPKLTTDAAGEFTADVNPNPNYVGEFGCIITAKGFGPTGGSLFADQDNKFVLPATTQITGSVVDQKGLPVSGATVVASYAVMVDSPTNDQRIARAVPLDFGPLKGQYEVKTDGKGAYAIPNVPAGAVITVALSDPGYVNQSKSTDKGVLTVPAFTALPDVPIAGKVLNKDGTPAVGLSVQARDATVTNIWIGSNGTTGSDGTYKITGLAAGKFIVEVQSQTDDSKPAQWIPPAPVTITTVQGKPAVVPDLTLSTGGIINGTVIDADTNEPVAGVRISFQVPSTAGQFPLFVNAISDASGKFTTHVYPGTNTINPQDAPGEYVIDNSQAMPSFTITDGQTMTIDPIKIHKGIAVSGVAVDDSGNPVPDISLNVQKAKTDDGWMNFRPQGTGPDGSFTLHQMVAGSYVIDPGADWTVVSPLTFDVPTTDSLKLVLKKVVGAPLSGLVTDQTGAPIAGVMVTYETIHRLGNGMGYGNNVSETSDADGKFTIPNAPTTADDIQKSGFTKDGYILQSGGDITKTGDQLSISPIIMLKLGGVIDGLVKNGLDKPVIGAWVLCPNAGTNPMPIQTDATGHFKLSSLPIGSVDIFAAKGNYCADKQVDATATESSVIITLDPAPAQPTTPDLQTAIQMIKQQQGTINADNPYFVRDQTGREIGMLDRDEGVNFINATVKMNAADFGIILDSLIDDEPSTAEWAAPIIQSIPDYQGSIGNDELMVGLAVAPYDQKMAKMLFDLAVKYEKLDQITDQNFQAATQLTALAYAIGSPTADGYYDKTMAALQEIIKKSTPVNGYSQTDWMASSMAQTLAEGSLTKAEKLIDTLTPNQRDNTIPQIVSELAKPYPGQALEAFHLLDTEKDTPTGSWAYNRAELTVLPLIYKTDPTGALKMAQGVSDLGQQASGLTVLADLMPLAEATPLYVEAETNAADQGNQDFSSACVAAHAWARDKILGAKLFKQAYDKLISGPAPGQYGQGPSYADFAFYYSRIDPAFSRMLIEKEYAANIANPTPYNSQGVSTDVAAMTAVDVQRAQAMEYAIKDAYTKFDAGNKIMQYVIATPQVRNTISFSRWSSGEDIKPHAATGW